MSMTDIAIYGGAFAVAIAFFFFVRWSAKTFGTQNTALARAAFAGLPDFDADDVLVYLGSAIGWDESRRRVAIWEKASGVRAVDRAEVGSWHSGTLLTVVLNRTTATPMVQLFPTDSDKPFFKVGVLDQKVCPVWAERLGRAFGAEKDREVHVRVLGTELAEKMRPGPGVETQKS